MSKIHLILILAISALVAFSVYLLREDTIENAQKVTSVETSVPAVSKNLENSEDAKKYIQGPLVLPNLEEGFKRCLNRGYSEIQKEILEEARDAFAEQSFDQGNFSWNKVIFKTQDGLESQLYLNSEFNLEISDKIEGKFIKSDSKEKFSLEEMKDLLLDKEIVLNEYTQQFQKGDLIMELVLADGVMKSLIINSPRKRVICKP